MKSLNKPCFHIPTNPVVNSGLFEGAQFVMIRPEFAARIQFDAFIKVFLHGRIAVNCMHIVF